MTADDAEPTRALRSSGQQQNEIMEGDGRIMAETGNQASTRGFFKRHAALWPSVFGIACAHMGLLVATQGSLRFTDQGVFTDGAGTVALIPCLIAALVLYRTRFICTRRLMAVLVRAAIALESAVLLVMGILRFTGLCTFPVRFALSVLATIAAALCVACWLRRAHDDEVPLGMERGVILVFGGMLVSQIPVFATVLLPDGLRCLAILPFAVAQFACLAWANRRSCKEGEDDGRADDYFSFVRSGEASRRFLVASAIGLAALSLVAGFLTGFPHGEPIPFTLPARAACFALTELMCVLFIVSTVRRHSRTMTVRVWIVMELLAAFALVLYCAFPAHLEIGAIATTMLGTLMTAFVWHLIIAFLSSGWRDPFYYAVIVWAIWTFARAFGRFVVLGVMPTGGDSHFTGTVISLLLLVSTQLILVGLIDVSQFAAGLARKGSGAESEAVEGEDAPAGASGRSAGGVAHLERILGLDEDSTLADARHAVVRHNAELMGSQFLLSEREVEVLALYASGFTQKRVAEQLHISQTTAHTHISRIYGKTGLHSRQELLDYMRQYGDM